MSDTQPDSGFPEGTELQTLTHDNQQVTEVIVHDENGWHKEVK